MSLEDYSVSNRGLKSGLTGTPELPWAEELAWGRLAAGTQTDPGAPLFPRIDPTAA